jgi:seryl-tRNA synthetase|tara:strand:+ start:545 stop:1249 length:705 start_codon:yes stop_codon:yes gene_type:complete
MSKGTKPTVNEMINSAGDGSGLQLPPAFVMVNPRQHRKWKKNNETVDGRSKGAKDLFSRIQKRKMKEETNVTEALSTDTERAQKQIQQGKKLGRQKDLQKKRGEAKEKMMRKTKEMDTLMKARLSDFKKKASAQTKKLKKEETKVTTDIMNEGQDVIQVALDVATSELNPQGEGSFAKIQFSDGGVQNLDNFSAKRIAATYAQLDDTHKQQFQYLLNKDASTYQTALDFAVRNV